MCHMYAALLCSLLRCRARLKRRAARLAGHAARAARAVPHVPHVPRTRSGDLLVANANKDATKLLVYGPCNATSPRRAYRAVIAEQSTTLVHPYG